MYFPFTSRGYRHTPCPEVIRHSPLRAMSTSLQSPSDALRAARVMWAEHTRGLYDPPLDSEHVALLERILGEEGMRRAIEEDPV